MSFHEKAGRSQGNSGFIVSSWFFFADKVFSRRVATVAMLPSALPRSESFRSVHVGRSRFSRCCHLISDLSFHVRVKRGPGVRRSHRNSALAFVFSLPGTILILFCVLVFTRLLPATSPESKTSKRTSYTTARGCSLSDSCALSLKEMRSTFTARTMNTRSAETLFGSTYCTT